MEPATFPSEYVKELRSESAGWRTKAQRADKLSQLLVTEIARSTGRMADPRDLAFSDELLTDGVPDSEKVTAAIDKLLAERPHLADRRPRGSVDQGARGSSDASVSDLGAILRSRAG